MSESEKQARRQRLIGMMKEFGNFEIDDLSEAAVNLESEYKTNQLKFHSAGGAVPVQAEGFVDGKYFYFRFRHDNARLMVGEYKDDKSLPENAETVEILDYSGEPMNGFLTPEEFKACFKKLLDMYLQK